MSKKLWTPELLCKCTRLSIQGMNYRQISETIGMPYQATKKNMCKLNRNAKKWGEQFEAAAHKDTKDTIMSHIKALDHDRCQGMPLQHEMAGTRLGSNDGEWESTVVLNDAHIEEGSDNKVWELALSFVRDFKPYRVLLNGDILHLSCISHWNKNKARLVEGRRLKADYKLLQGYIDQIHPSCNELVYILGNHEDWIEQCIDETPAYQGFIEIQNNIHGVDKWIASNGVFELGHLHVTHGFFVGKYACSKHIQKFHDNVLFGHTHAISLQADNIYGVRPIASWNNGCLCSTNPDYMKGKEPQWQHGFSVVWHNKNTKEFHVEQVWIINDKIIYGGKLYE